MPNAHRTRTWRRVVSAAALLAGLHGAGPAGPARAQEAAATDTPGFWSRVAATTPAGRSERPPETTGFMARAFDGTGRIWSGGRHDLFLSGYSVHVPWRYEEERREQLNTVNWGAGYGRSVRGGTQDWLIYGIAFRDSHWEPQYLVGWAWMKTGDAGPLRFGVGYTGFLTGREEWASWCPVPAALPLVSVGVAPFHVYATYIPGWDTVYVFGRVTVGRRARADGERDPR